MPPTETSLYATFIIILAKTNQMALEQFPEVPSHLLCIHTFHLSAVLHYLSGQNILTKTSNKQSNVSQLQEIQ